MTHIEDGSIDNLNTDGSGVNIDNRSLYRRAIDRVRDAKVAVPGDVA